jgi:hypothetical protein
MRGKKRDIGGIIKVGDFPLQWSVKSEPIWGSTGGDIGLRLSVVRHDETLTRHGTMKAWRELILQFPFEKPKHASRFAERPNITPEKLTAAIQIAMEAGWEPYSRGRAMELILEEGDLPEA